MIVVVLCLAGAFAINAWIVSDKVIAALRVTARHTGRIAKSLELIEVLAQRQAEAAEKLPPALEVLVARIRSMP